MMHWRIGESAQVVSRRVMTGMLLLGLLGATGAGFAASKITTYTYDDYGNRTSETINGFTPGGTPVSRTTTWAYDGPLHQLSFEDGPRTDVNDYTYYRYYNNDPAEGVNRVRLKEIENALGILTRSSIQYTATGKVQSESRPNGVTLSYTYYPGNDRLESLRESDGASSRVTRWTYLATGEVETITSGFGSAAATTLTFGYDDARRLVRITDGLGNYIEYTLDTEGNRLEEKIFDTSSALARQVSQTFDIYNRLDDSTQANESANSDFAANGTLDKQTDGNNVVTDYSYDALKRLTQVVQDQGGTDPATANATTTYGYDVADRLTRVTDPVNGTTTYAYDDLGNLVSQTSPDTGTTLFQYDTAGNLVSRTDAENQVINYQYDALNRLVSLDAPGDEDDIVYVYDSCPQGVGRLCSVTQGAATALPEVTSYSYNGLGDVTTHQGVGYVYDEAGRITAMTYPSGATVSYAYDAAGRISQVDLLLDGQGSVLVNNLAYAPFGGLTGATFGNGLALSQQYDAAYRLDSQSLGGFLSLDYGYDANGNLISLLDTLDTANDYLYGYDPLNRLTDGQRNGGPVADDPGGSPVPDPLFTNPPAMLAMIQTMNNETATPPGMPSEPWLTMAVRNLTADSVQLALERAESAPGSASSAESVGWVALQAGRTGSFTAADGQSVNYEALVSADNIRGWGTCNNAPLTGGFVTPPVAVATPARHDGGDGGWLRRCAHTATAIGLTYDEDTYRDTERNHTTEAASLLAFSRPFDAALTDHDGSSWHLEAGEVSLNDTASDPSFVSVNFQQAYGEPPVVVVLPTSEGSDPTAVRIRNVTTAGFEISQVEPANSDGVSPSMTVPYVVIETGTHQFPDGTWLHAGHLAIGQVQHGGGVTGAESWFTLNFPDQPVNPVPPTTAQPGQQAFQYDANGNRVQLTSDGAITAYAYEPASNRQSTAGGQTVNVDANGNVFRLGTLNLDHNVHNRIVLTVEGTTLEATQYGYNGLGQRVVKDADGVVTRFAYDLNGQLLGDYQDDGTTIREYVYLNNIPVAQIIGEGASAEVIYLHTDQLGTPRRATDAVGELVWRWDSDAFGAAKANEDPDGNGVPVTVPLRFPGQYYDQETGLHYNYFRYYDPSTGRYITSDPIGLDGGLNTYAYVGGNPITFYDQYGLYWECSYWGGNCRWLQDRGTLGPFGSLCGSGASATWIPDGPWKRACEFHDACYGTCGSDKEVCDLMFLLQSGNLFYYGAISMFGGGPFEDAQEEACEDAICSN